VVSRPLAPLLEARSVAVVGASARPGSFGNQLLAQLLEGGYRGAVHPVNPRYREVLGLPCHPSLAEAPGPVDLAVLAVPNAALEAQLAVAAAGGVPAAVIFASCQDPVPPPGGGPPLAEGCGGSPWTPVWRCAAATAWASSTSSTA
jgi:acetate---CoA ligase (ADP-forming)